MMNDNRLNNVLGLASTMSSPKNVPVLARKVRQLRYLQVGDNDSIQSEGKILKVPLPSSRQRFSPIKVTDGDFHRQEVVRIMQTNKSGERQLKRSNLRVPSLVQEPSFSGQESNYNTVSFRTSLYISQPPKNHTEEPSQSGKFIQTQAHLPLKMSTQLAEHMLFGAAKQLYLQRLT